MKNSFFKVGVSVFAVFCLVGAPLLGAVPRVSADFIGTGDGSPRDPYEIASCADLVQFAAGEEYLDSDFLLMQDLDCSANGNDVMIGGTLTPYTGEFDGQGNTITVDLELEGADEEDETDNFVGLFRVVSDASIEDLGVAGTILSTGDYVGAIAGDVDLNSSIRRVRSVATVTGDNYVGGVAGAVRNSAVLENAYANGTVTSDFGQDASTFTGGLVGLLQDGHLENSYSAGVVNGYSRVGGLLGGVMESDFDVPSIRNNFSIAEVNVAALDNRYGAVIGAIEIGQDFTILNNFYSENLSLLGADKCVSQNDGGVVSDIAGSCEGVDTVADEDYFYDEANAPFTIDELARWNPDRVLRIWKFREDGYPALWAFESSGDFVGEGTGTSEDPFIISTCEELENVDNDLDAYYSVEPVGAATEMDCTASGNDIMVRSNIDYFSGNFDGNDVNIIVDIGFEGGYVGLFAKIDRATLTDVVVSGSVVGEGEVVGGVVGYGEDSVITGSSFSGSVENTADDELVEGEDTGGFAGWITDSVVSDSFSAGTVLATSIDVGGFAGDLDESEVSNVYSTSDVEGMGYLGGLIGDSDLATIEQVYATGNVTSLEGDHVGGLIGDLNEGELNIAYATGVVTAEGANIGGLIGRIRDAAIVSNSYAIGQVNGRFDTGGLVGINRDSNIINSYSVGAVSGDDGLGGLVGFEEEESLTSHSFWDLLTSGMEESDGGEGLSSTEMKQIATYTTDLEENAWDFDTIWAIHPRLNNGYPYLLMQGLVAPAQSGGSSSGSKSVRNIAVEGLTYEQEVAEVLARGIVTENPTAETNKCEALTMMARVFEWSVPASASVESKYSDVPAWCASVAAYATDRGIVEGRTVDSLGLESPVTRFEVAAMIYRELQKQNYDFKPGLEVIKFSDFLVEWAMPAVNMLGKQNIIKGFADGTFGGNKGILKQDLGVMLIRI